MLVLGVDVETTGLDIVKSEITEVGAVLWDTDRNTPAALMSRTVIINGTVPPEILALTGITPELVSAPLGDEPALVYSELAAMAELADYYVAHNAEFDRKFLMAAASSCGVSLPDMQWIDTTQDIKFPAKIKNRSLVALCAEHGFVNPFPHRAVTDVLAMLKLMAFYDFDEIVKRHNEPTLRVVADVTYDERDKAKAAGFYWDGQVKQWYRNFKQSEYKPEAFAFLTKGTSLCG